MKKTRCQFSYVVALIVVLPVIAVCLFFAALPLPSDSVHKVAHFSFDDVYGVLMDISQNENVYDSVFDNPLLGFLKQLNVQYGAKFVLYIYDRYPAADFDIADVTDKYKTELMANSGWLRFGYHTIEPATSFDQETSLADFEKSFQKVQAEIRRFAGEESRSDVLRLNYFRGDDEKVRYLLSQGITALLCADDARRSYNLPEKQHAELQREEFIVFQGMSYYNTDLRLDETRCLTYDLLKLWDQAIIVLFMHEWALDEAGLERVESGVKWLARHGYTFSFLDQ